MIITNVRQLRGGPAVVAGRRAGVYRRGCNGRDLLTDRLSQGSFKGNPYPIKEKGDVCALVAQVHSWDGSQLSVTN